MRALVILLLLEPAAAAVRFLILRHGETNHNAAGIIQGSSDISRLTPRGIKQAAAAGAALGEMDDLRIDRVFVSPLTRARQTLETLSQYRRLPEAPAAVLPELREIDLGPWESRAKAELQAEEPAMYEAWKRAPLQLQLAGEFPVVALWERAARAWPKLREGGGDDDEATTLVVCHNAIGQALVYTAFGLDDPALFRRLSFPNCGAIELEWSTGSPRATRWRWRLPGPPAVPPGRLPGSAAVVPWRVGGALLGDDAKFPGRVMIY